MALTESFRNEEYTATLNLGEDADQVAGEYEVYVSLIHDWGDIVVDAERATRAAEGIYTYTFSATNCVSSGTHRIKWAYTLSSVDYVKNDYVKIVQQYVDIDTFFDNHPEYEDEFYDAFPALEKKARAIIDTYCGQDFQFFSSKSLTLDGNGKTTLTLPVRLDSLTSCTIDTDDVTDNIENVPDTDWYLRYSVQGDIHAGYYRTKFTEDSTVVVDGDWGWPYVPTNVELACETLIEDLISDDRENYKYGITRVWMDTQRFDFDPNIFYSTGNMEVDVLLMDYVLFNPEYI